MAKPTFYPTRLTEETLSEQLAAETRRSFDKIVDEMKNPPAAAPAKNSAKPEKSFITVLVNMPHVKTYGKPPMMSLTYGCSFAVTVGDKVLCPPTRLNSKWTTGIVTGLEDNGYRGPVKYVAPLKGSKKGGAR